MSSLFLMSTITDRRTADAFLQLYEAHGVNVTLHTVCLLYTSDAADE